MKKLFVLILTLLLLLTSCDKGTGSNDTTTASDTTVQQQISIFVDGNTNFKIIRADRSTDDCITAVVNLNNVFLEKFDSKCEVQTDWDNEARYTGIVENDEYEILVGYTNRKESRDAFAELDGMGDSYIIKVINNKIVILGNIDYITLKAIDIFVASYVDTVDDKNLVMNYSDIVIEEYSAQTVPVYNDAELRLMTYNICGVEDDIYQRSEIIVNEVYNYMPDILCLQEVTSVAYSCVLNDLYDFYTVTNAMHLGTTIVNYTPILYRTDKFTLIESGVEWLNSRYEETNTKSLSWAVFEDKVTNKRFAVINLHGALWTTTYTLPEGKTYAEMRSLAEQWRVDNVNQTIEKYNELVAKYGDIPGLFAGDYNANSTTDAYKTAILANLQDSEKAATVSKVDSYASTHTVGEMPENGKTIDHVFGTTGINFYVHYLVTDKIYLDASDHCAVYVDFALN